MTLDPHTILDRTGEADDGEIDVGLAALALAGAERPTIDLEPYAAHLESLARAVAEREATRCPHEALASVLAEDENYRGDDRTYDDLRNADLVHVIDRRQGLPVALGVIYMSIARRLGWHAAGLAFPGHFLIRVGRDDLAILDPFNGGIRIETPDLRRLLKAQLGSEAELAPEHYAPVTNREVLLRLQNNIKLRRLKGRDVEGALVTVGSMRRIAPDRVDLIREAGLINAHLGRVTAAVALIEEYRAKVDSEPLRSQADALIADLRSRLN